MKVRAILLLLILTGVALGQDVLILSDDSKPKEKAGEELILEAPTEPVQEEKVRSFSLFYEKWRDFRAAYESGNVQEYNAILQQILDIKRRNGIPRVSELAAGTLRYGNAEMEKKNPAEALRLFQVAAQLDSSFGYAYFCQSRAYLERGIKGFAPAIGAVLKGLSAPRSSLLGAAYFKAKFSLIVIGALVLMGFAFALAMLFKYNHLLRHDAVEKYGARYNATVVHFAVFAILFLPVLLFFGFLWLAPFWILMFWGYGRLSERLLGIIFLIAFVLAYPVYHRVMEYSSALTDSSVSAYVTALSEGPSPRSIRDFGSYAASHPDDQNATVLLAYLYKTDNNVETSVQILQKQTIDHPNDAVAYNNLGVLYFDQGQTDSALALVQKATMLDPRNAAYRYNLSKIYRAKFNFDQAEPLMKEARSMDPVRVKLFDEAPPETLVSEIPDTRVITGRIRAKIGSAAGSFLNIFAVIGVLFLVLTPLLNMARLKKKAFARDCIKCGKAFCRKCQPGARGYGFCTQCHHMFVKKDGVSPASRKEKMEEIESFTRRQAIMCRATSLILPGFGSLYNNRIVAGIALLAVWCLALALLIYHKEFGTLWYFESADSNQVLTLACLFFMLAAIVVGQLPFAIREKP